MIDQLKKWWPLTATLAFFLLLILKFNLDGLSGHCIHAQDFGIYQQGLYEFFEQKSWNPYRTIRDLPVFNDHVNPILFVASLFSALFGHSPFALVVWEWLSLLAGVATFTFFLIRKQKIASVLIGVYLVLFSKGLLTGLMFPIHPGIWSLPLWPILFYNIRKENFWPCVLTAFGLCLFRESYPFAIVTLCAYFVFNRRWKHFWSFLFIGAGWIYIDFILRPEVLEIRNYGGEITAGLKQNPIGFFRDKLLVFNWKGFLKIFYPFILPIIWILKNEKIDRRHMLWPVLLAVTPLWGVHFLANKFHFHYGIIVAAPLLSLVLLSGFPHQQGRSLWIPLTLVLFALSSMGAYTKMLKRSFLSLDKSCKIHPQKTLETQLIQQTLEKAGKSTKTISTGNLVPLILAPGRKIYQFKAFSAPQEYYDFIVLEQDHPNGIHPLSSNQIDRIRAGCQKYADQTLISSPFFLFLKGKFPYSCIRSAID